MEIPHGRILIADDEAHVRDMLQRLLQKAGHEVICATDGRAAVTAAREERVHLAILDIQMPRLDGIGANGLTCSRSTRISPGG